MEKVLEAADKKEEEKKEMELVKKRQAKQVELREYPVAQKLYDEGIITDTSTKIMKKHMSELLKRLNQPVSSRRKREDMLTLCLKSLQSTNAADRLPAESSPMDLSE